MKDTIRSIGKGLPRVLGFLAAMAAFVWLAFTFPAALIVVVGIVVVLFISWVIGTSPEGD